MKNKIGFMLPVGKLPKQAMFLLIALMIILLMVAAFLLIIRPFIYRSKLNNKQALTSNNLYISELHSSDSEVTLPNMNKIYFNDGHHSSKLGGVSVSKVMPLYSKADVSKQFGVDPLLNIWIPADFESCYCTSSKQNSYYNFAYYSDKSGRDLLWLNVSYMKNINDPKSQTIRITIANNHPAISDIEPNSNPKVSIINHTSVTVSYQISDIQDNSGSIYEAKFTYKNLGYTVFASNGTSQTDFVNVLTSIIRD